MDALEAIAAAGRMIADLKVRLNQAERAVADLQVEKRTLQTALGAGGRGLPRCQPLSLAAPAANRSHLDEALAAVVEGLGPERIRLAPAS